MRKTLVRLLGCGIVLTSFVDDDKVLPVIEAGALSYLLKTAKSREIADALYISVKTVKTHITRCVFHETFRDMGIPWLTEAFCRSDEIVFNEYSPSMKFHRGTEETKNTIARGGSRCVFVFERVETPEQSLNAKTKEAGDSPVS